MRRKPNIEYRTSNIEGRKANGELRKKPRFTINESRATNHDEN